MENLIVGKQVSYQSRNDEGDVLSVRSGQVMDRVLAPTRRLASGADHHPMHYYLVFNDGNEMELVRPKDIKEVK